MFFVFPFLMLAICFSGTNNFVLEKDSRRPHLKQNYKDHIFQDIQHDSSAFPARKSVIHISQNLTNTQNIKPRLHQFSKKPDIPIKRHIQENDEEDISSIIKSTKSSVATSARELKRKWPVVELFTHSEDFKENLQYFDEFEQKEISFLRDIGKESKVTELPPKYINRYVDLHNNHSKVKPVSLRSLLQQNFPGMNCEDGDQCVCRIPSKTGKTTPRCNTNKCTRTTIVYSLVNFYVPYEIVNIPNNIPTGTPKPVTTTMSTTPRPPSAEGIDMGFPMGIPMGVPIGVPMGVPMGYPAGYPAPYPPAFPPAIPAGPVPFPQGLPPYYQLNICEEVPKHKKPCKTHANDYLYYDDEPENIYFYDEDSIVKKIKHEKKHKDVDVQYDVEKSRNKKPNRNPKCRHDQAELATDIFIDIKKSYSDTVIKDCYCCSASCCGINFRIVLLLLSFFCCIK